MVWDKTFYVPGFLFKPELRVLCIADTHGAFKVYHPEKPVLPGEIDAVLLLGDIYEDDLFLIFQMFNGLPIYAVCGNHESPDMYTRHNVPVIHESTNAFIKNYTITGWSGTYCYKEGIPVSYDQKQGLQEEKKMPKADIFISHDVPYKAYDKGLVDSHPGLIGIRQYLEHRKCKLHIHGHIHDSGHITRIKGIPSMCVYTMAYIKICHGKVQVLSL